MKIYHMLGHNHKWSLDTYFENNIGDGFFFSAYNFEYGKIGSAISGYYSADYLQDSMIDLQYYGRISQRLGKLGSYPFHPVNLKGKDHTMVGGIECVEHGIEYQHNLNLKNIIIPSFYYTDLEKLIKSITRINNVLKRIRKKNTSYYLTLALPSVFLFDESTIDNILVHITDMDISFDGFYLVAEPIIEYKKKLCTNYNYYHNTIKILRTLKKQGFKTILGYSNWDGIVFSSICEMDYISIGTYENLRNFSIKRFTEVISGGKSDGWYFSEKLLNFIKAQELVNFHRNKCLHVIANENNIFSDVILREGYDWNTHKPDVHKNYLLAIYRLYNNLVTMKSSSKKIKHSLSLVRSASDTYRHLAENHRIYLHDESSDYHLATWATILMSYA